MEILIFGKLFKKKRKETAVIFVDFEHWTIALDNKFEMRPDFPGLYNKISAKYDVKKTLVFGDFTQPKLRRELDSVREVTNDIIDTQNSSDVIVKDFTDFIILDHIYRYAEEKPDTDVFILITGDGHFSSVITYLRIKKKKKVVIIGVRDEVSKKLKNVADECIELPLEEDEENYYKRLIIENFIYLDGKTKTGKKNYITFTSTSNAVALYNKVNENKIRGAMSLLIDEGILEKQVVVTDDNQSINTLAMNWEKLKNSRNKDLIKQL